MLFYMVSKKLAEEGFEPVITDAFNNPVPITMPSGEMISPGYNIGLDDNGKAVKYTHVAQIAPYAGNNDDNSAIIDEISPYFPDAQAICSTRMERRIYDEKGKPMNQNLWPMWGYHPERHQQAQKVEEPSVPSP